MPKECPQHRIAWRHLKGGRKFRVAFTARSAGEVTLDLKGPIMNIPERVNRETETFSLAEEAREGEEEAKKIRRLQLMMSMVMSVIGQDPSLTVEEASELAAGAKRAALAMFPDKELAFDLLYKPRLQRLMKERFRLQ